MSQCKYTYIRFSFFRLFLGGRSSLYCFLCILSHHSIIGYISLFQGRCLRNKNIYYYFIFIRALMNCVDKVDTFLFIHCNDANWLPSRETFYESLSAYKRSYSFDSILHYSSNVNPILTSF